MKYEVIRFGTIVSETDPFNVASLQYDQITFRNIDPFNEDNKCCMFEYRIIATPTIICLRNNKEVSRTVGDVSYPELCKLIENLTME